MHECMTPPREWAGPGSESVGGTDGESLWLLGPSHHASLSGKGAGPLAHAPWSSALEDWLEKPDISKPQPKLHPLLPTFLE